MNLHASISRAITGLFSSIRTRLERRFSRAMREESKGRPSSDRGTEDVRRSPVMASLFPCFYNKGHGHPVGRPHTCNSFLLGPSDYKKREGIKCGAHTIIVSHWSAYNHGKKVAA